MLAALLGSHSAIAIGRESHFFRRTTEAERREAIRHGWPTRAADYLAGLETAGIPLIEQFETSRGALEQALSARQPSEAALLDALMSSYARAAGKPRWGEKTPNHILHLEEIRRLFPDAFIIHITRDPRDVAVSMTRLPMFANSPLVNAYLWQEWVEQGLSFESRDERTTTVRFEELLSSTETELRRICDFVGENFELAMLDTSRTAKNLRTPNEVWKKEVGKPLNPDNAFRWKREGDPALSRTISLICSAEMDALGYAGASPVRVLTGLWLHDEEVSRTEEEILRLASRDWVIRRSRVPILDLDRAEDQNTVVCGGLRALEGRFRTLRCLFALTVALAKHRLAGDPVPHLLAGHRGRGKTGWTTVTIACLLGKPLQPPQ